MNKDQVKGQLAEVNGKLKEVVGVTVGDDALQAEGEVEAQTGKVQSAYGDLKEAIKDSIK